MPGAIRQTMDICLGNNKKINILYIEVTVMVESRGGKETPGKCTNLKKKKNPAVDLFANLPANS